MSFNILYESIPVLGTEINKISESPNLEYMGYKFIGSWQKETNEKYKLIEVKWQHNENGHLLSNEQFIQRFFIF